MLSELVKKPSCFRSTNHVGDAAQSTRDEFTCVDINGLWCIREERGAAISNAVIQVGNRLVDRIHLGIHLGLGVEIEICNVAGDRIYSTVQGLKFADDGITACEIIAARGADHTHKGTVFTIDNNVRLVANFKGRVRRAVADRGIQLILCVILSKLSMHGRCNAVSSVGCISGNLLSDCGEPFAHCGGIGCDIRGN